LGCDLVEISSGFHTLPLVDFLRLIERAKGTGLSVTAEIGIQFGAGGSSASRTWPPKAWATRAGRSIGRAAHSRPADLIMLESEGITEKVREWRTDVAALFASELWPGARHVRGRRATGLSAGTSRTTVLTSTCSSTPARHSSSNACARACGPTHPYSVGCIPTAADGPETVLAGRGAGSADDDLVALHAERVVVLA
jgi:hypothetical protein